MQLYIKNIVCNRCIAAVNSVLDDLQLAHDPVLLGEAVLHGQPDPAQLNQLRERLEALGFELLDDARKRLVAQIKTIIIEQVHYPREDKRYNLSHILSARLHKDYDYLSRLFSDVEGVTIEKYLIAQKIEKAKELLAYNEASLSDIAFELGYSSVAHLSAQFKKVTGLTPSHFRSMGGNRRKTIDGV